MRRASLLRSASSSARLRLLRDVVRVGLGCTHATAPCLLSVPMFSVSLKLGRSVVKLGCKRVSSFVAFPPRSPPLTVTGFSVNVARAVPSVTREPERVQVPVQAHGVIPDPSDPAQLSPDAQAMFAAQGRGHRIGWRVEAGLEHFEVDGVLCERA